MTSSSWGARWTPTRPGSACGSRSWDSTWFGAPPWATTTALDDAELVVATGGLGPTADDRTREAVADLLDAPLELDVRLLEALKERFRESGIAPFPASNEGQAMVPRGARVLSNPHGTAPGLALEREGSWVVLLPGVPREMKGIWEEELRSVLAGLFDGRLRPAWHRTLHTTGIPESRLSEEVERLLPRERGPVELAYLPDLRGVDLRFTARGERAAAEAWFDRLEAALEPYLRGYRFRAEQGDLVEAVAAALERRGLTLATAESCTGGLISKRLTDRAGASAWYVGGVVAYADAVKIRELGLEPAVLEREGAVSEAVARAMAEGVARRMGTDAGIGITGVAGPTGGTEAKPVGLVWYAAHVGGRTRAGHRRFPGDRESVRERSGQAALALLLGLVEAPDSQEAT
ncbi:MAG: nicotinamide-nucleotide amidohydrolase family protein [Gemmatimonadetes bacterium]|nr:nicotinamide-nucleotide amidohydrolase family protein [Gemmatimonadota bacterium]